MGAYEIYNAVTTNTYYLWEGKEVAKHQLSICLAALLSKTKQHCRMKNSPQTQIITTKRDGSTN